MITAYKNGSVDTSVGTSGVYTDDLNRYTSGFAGITFYGASDTGRGDSFEAGEL